MELKDYIKKVILESGVSDIEFDIRLYPGPEGKILVDIGASNRIRFRVTADPFNDTGDRTCLAHSDQE